MVSWAGGTYDVLPPAGLARARETVEGLHRLGVVHGDVACRNMGYDPATGRVVLFDFSEGQTRAGFRDCLRVGVRGGPGAAGQGAGVRDGVPGDVPILCLIGSS